MSAETPVDPAAVQADDAWLDKCLSRGNAALVASIARKVDVEAELARVLVAWRRDVDAEPVGELVDTNTVLAAVKAGKRRRPVLARIPFRGRRRSPPWR